MSTETYTLDQVCSILGCESEKVQEQIIRGDLPALKFGRSWIIPCEAFKQRLNELALEEAQERRRARSTQNAAGRAIATAKALSVPAKQPRQARIPPTLPALQSPGTSAQPSPRP